MSAKTPTPKKTSTKTTIAGMPSWLPTVALVALAMSGMSLLFDAGACNSRDGIRSELATTTSTATQNKTDIAKIGPEVVNLRNEFVDHASVMETWRADMDGWRAAANADIDAATATANEAKATARKANRRAGWALRTAKKATAPAPAVPPTASATAPVRRVKVTRTVRVIPSS